MNGEPDHVHLLVSLPPNLELSGFVNNLKTTTSRLIRKEFANESDGAGSQCAGEPALVL
jgi:putative transposase